MLTFIKFSLSFVLSFLVLSIPIQDRALFDHIHESTSPFTEEFFQIVKRNTSKAVEETSEVGRRAFNNTRPVKDQVQAQQSSLKKEADFHEDYTVEEKELLLRVLENTDS